MTGKLDFDVIIIDTHVTVTCTICLVYYYNDNQISVDSCHCNFVMVNSIVDMCGVEGKRRLCELNVTSSSPALATRHIRSVLLVNSPMAIDLLCNK